MICPPGTDLGCLGLAGAGLIHELGGDFVAATRAAQRMDDLDL